MSESKVPEANNQNNLFFYWNILKKWKYFILIDIFLITIIASLVAFLLPPWYYSFAVIKPSENTGNSIFSAVLGAKGLSGIGKSLNVGGLQYSDLDYYKSLLSSRHIAISLINKFDLKKTYNEKYTFKTIDQLLSNSLFQDESKSNLLIVGVYDKDPIRAKEMVSYYLLMLDSVITEISKTDLISNRQMIEKRYLQNLADLDSAQLDLKKFQEKYGVVLPEEQFTSTIKAYAEIAAQKLLLESKLNSMVLNLDVNSPAIINMKSQINTLDEKLNEFSNKTDLSKNKDLFVSLGNAPELIDQYVTLYRNVTIQSKLLELIYPLYQQAQMDEMNNSPHFVIIDTPFVPEYKEKPKRSMIIIAGFVFSSLLSVFSVFLIEGIRKIKKKSMAIS